MLIKTFLKKDKKNLENVFFLDKLKVGIYGLKSVELVSDGTGTKSRAGWKTLQNFRNYVHQLYQPHFQGLSEERPWERGCSFISSSHATSVSHFFSFFSLFYMQRPRYSHSGAHQMHRMKYLLVFLKGYRNVLRDSPNDVLAGLMFAIMVVFELPPKLSLSNLQTKHVFV